MNVSRETQQKLDLYLELLRKWSPKINLVSQDSLKDAARRHFEDSLQISELVGADSETWTDLGAGGGFPGAVIAIVRAEQQPDFRMTLVESDQRKATFLRTVSRETQTPITVLAKRIEDIPPLTADVVSARALASLDKLLDYASLHLRDGGTCVFPKGMTWRQEVEDAQKLWRFTYKAHTSITNPDAAILEIGDLSRA
ncbi:16S rRNA (guanine(527)-N(7))-methyltransferase RsmG [Marivita sp. S6314]|uniref:16S rRNA (guanine(527)-N(7))-methyltransferase RsmG n=1 Tax=Marivita sp. S6314 TaxID=2926406 RepID=UPI001FF14536|nr:16S rRNA (guanine(527)-N(7))-methyltransferase RsmG [Marivita sp. S6314]MCK0151269.1 16S rRNA (guanine(527)-N(7))-methyltransferase RsmG [Marivita sp. S6314]